VALEIIVSDGNSSDDTRKTALAICHPKLTILSGEPGRSRQLNAGAAAARGDFLLFLHADSSFPDPAALCRGLAHLKNELASGRKEAVAGHFSVSFRRSAPEPSLSYAFLQAKGRLGRQGCIHGDQGFLISRETFNRCGPFTHGYGMLAETFFADRLGAWGRWVLLPATIQTSARRFETEGFRERQILSAIIMTAAALEWEPFFQRVPALYCQQRLAGRLDLCPVLTMVGDLIRGLPPRERRIFWQKVGEYVLANAWQAALFCDVRQGFRQGLANENLPTPWLEFYEGRCHHWLNNRFGRWWATLLARLWFSTVCRRYRQGHY
jgi:hypothetical protein